MRFGWRAPQLIRRVVRLRRLPIRRPFAGAPERTTVPDTRRRRQPTRLLGLLVLTGALAGASCTSPEAPQGVAGVYHLTGYTLGAGDLPLPYVQAASTPGDTDKYWGATLSLLKDSTWVNILQHQYCPAGSCSPVHSDTIHGTYTHTSGDTTGTWFTFWIPGGPSPSYTGAHIVGRRLELSQMWIYER